MNSAAFQLNTLTDRFTYRPEWGTWFISATIHGQPVGGRGHTLQECCEAVTADMRHTFDDMTSGVCIDGDRLHWQFPEVRPDWLR